MNFRFPKQEKLKSAKKIEQLFAEGKTITKFPVKVFYLLQEDFENHQATFAVPKRNFKSAVDRNRIKRQLRESYRLHKHMLTNESGKKFALLFLYISKDEPRHAQLEKAMVKLLNMLADEVS